MRGPNVDGSAASPTADELARAWDALRSGQFRDPAHPAGLAVLATWPTSASDGRPLTGDPRPAGRRRVAETPVPGPVLLVVGAHGWSGASTTALLLAEAVARDGAFARLVDAADPATSGLAGAAVTEHGHDESGHWRQGSRTVVDAVGQVRHVWLERLDRATPSVAAVPDAPPARVAVEPAALTVVDAGRPLTDLLRTAQEPTGERHWLVQLLRTAAVVVTARATVAGVQRAGSAVAALHDLRTASDAASEQVVEFRPQGATADAHDHTINDCAGSSATGGAAGWAPLTVALVGTSHMPRLLKDHVAATLPGVTLVDRRGVGGVCGERLALLPTPGDLTIEGVSSSPLPRRMAPAAARLLHATGFRTARHTAGLDDVPGERPARRWRGRQ